MSWKGAKRKFSGPLLGGKVRREAVCRFGESTRERTLTHPECWPMSVDLREGPFPT